MKKLILAVMFLGLLVFSSSMVFAFGEIIPTTPIVISPPAAKLIDYSIIFEPDSIIVKFNFYDAGNNIVKDSVCTIIGTDYTTLMAATVQAGNVGFKFSDIMFKAIRNKCKTILGITGTVN